MPLIAKRPAPEPPAANASAIARDLPAATAAAAPAIGSIRFAAPAPPPSLPTAPDPQAALAPHRAVVEALATEAMAIAIQTPADLELAADVLGQVKARAKELDGLKAVIVAPVELALKRARAAFKPLTDRLDAAEAHLKSSTLAFRRQQQVDAEEYAQRVKAEEARLAREDTVRRAAAAGSLDEAKAIRAEGVDTLQTIQSAPVYVPPPASAPGVSVRKVWSFEVRDVRALAAAVADGRVPADFLTANSAAIRKAITGGVRAVPGVEIFQVEQVAAR